ncbi:DUF1275 family protein [Methylocapsa acidiphila]|uniref:DUF1275 family protein n=1 Tax=Methylocapsa acidiphila TaxID=133552 RepID=UPI0003FE73AB|nr:DUF1275 family protein [Methylocapsa acidiphila]
MNRRAQEPCSSGGDHTTTPLGGGRATRAGGGRSRRRNSGRAVTSDRPDPPKSGPPASDERFDREDLALALLGLALGQGRVIAALTPFAALAGFLLGAAAASAFVELARDKLLPSKAIRALLAIEAGLLVGFALLFQIAPPPVAGAWLYGLIPLGAAAMGLQSVAARLIGRPGITTVVFTSTLTAIATAATAAVLRPPRRLPVAAKRQIGIFATYGVGAATCGLMTCSLIGAGGSFIAFAPLAAVIAALWLHLRLGRGDARGTQPMP